MNNDEYGWTPLLRAASHGHYSVVTLLLEKGANPSLANKSGDTPLYWAAYNGHREVAALLLGKGVDPNRADKKGKKPIDVAREKGRNEILSLLKKWAAFCKLFNPAVSADLRGFGAAIDALSDASPFELTFLRRQLEGRKPTDSAQQDGYDKVWTLLRTLSVNKLYDLAAATEDQNGFNSFLNAFSDVTLDELTFHPQSGDSLLHILSRKGQVSGVSALLAKGAPLNALSKVGLTCLEEAIMCGHYSVVELLLQKGVDISQAKQAFLTVDMSGKSAESRKSIPESIRKLLDKTHQCLVAARAGFDAESSSESFTQLYMLEQLLLEEAIPNATMDGHNALGFALGLHQPPERRKQENIAAVACLLGRNAELSSKVIEGDSSLSSQSWSPTMKALLEEAIELKKTDQVVLYRADLIVVGNGASGKTTLLHRMKWDTFLEGATMTDGIDMTHLRIGPVKLNGRDSAGQPIYAHTISLFFREDAIYMAVFNPRVENNVDALTQFLHMVKNGSPQARVMLATTRADELEMDGIMLADLRSRFPMICGVFPVDSLSGRGVENVRKFLLQEVLVRPSTKWVVSAALPRMIDRVMRYAEEHMEIFSVSRKQLLSIMGEPDLNEEEQNRLMDQLVSSSTIYKLSSSGSSSPSSDPVSDPVFILHPQQLADVYACVVTRKPETLERTGRLSKEGILNHSDRALKSVWGNYPEALWKCGDGPSRRPSLFLRLLHDSGLAYEVFDKFGRPQGRSVVPCLMPDKPAGFDGDVNDESNLLKHFVPYYVKSTILSLEKLQVSFSSLPFTFFAQLLAGLRKMAMDGGAWRNGAVLSAGVSFALLKEDRSGISISLLGRNRSVRSVVLLTMLQVMQKFPSMAISRIALTVGGREWSGDDIEEALHDGHGVLYSTKINARVDVHSLWMLFPQDSQDKEEKATVALLSPPASSPAIYSGHLGLLQRTLNRAKVAKSMDFLVLVNRYLQSCGPSLLQIMGAPRPRQGVPRPLWVVLQHTLNKSFCAMPFFPHYVPDEPWMSLEAAKIPFIPPPPAVETDAQLAVIRDLLSDCFATMRGSVADMLPSGWELAQTQSLATVDPNLMAQREKDFFVCVDGTIFAKEFAAKAKAMKTLSLEKKSPLPPEQIDSSFGGAKPACESVLRSDGISVAAIRFFYEQHVKDKMPADCTTADMLPVIKSLSKADPGDCSGGVGLSYCQLLRRQTHATASTPSSSEEVGAATVFISHAWKYNFYEFLAALEVRFQDHPSVRLWIDIFCHNQHDELTSDEWITKFEDHIVRIQHTVMIVFPWANPIPFTRAWCLLEVFYNTKNGVLFEVYLTETQRSQFFELVKKDPGQAMLIFSRISTRNSTCWVLNDQLRIHSLIESSVGFEAVDKKVHEAIAKALQVTPTVSLPTQQRSANRSGERISRTFDTTESKETIENWLRVEGLIGAEKVAEKIEVTVHVT